MTFPKTHVDGEVWDGAAVTDLEQRANAQIDLHTPFGVRFVMYFPSNGPSPVITLPLVIPTASTILGGDTIQLTASIITPPIQSALDGTIINVVRALETPNFPGRLSVHFTEVDVFKSDMTQQLGKYNSNPIPDLAPGHSEVDFSDFGEIEFQTGTDISNSGATFTTANPGVFFAMLYIETVYDPLG